MATEIKMPDFEGTVEEAKLLRWLKNEGDFVKRGEPLCEVETAKAVSELESIAEGVLLKQMVAPDADVEAGSVIAWIGAKGDSIAPAPAPEKKLPEKPVPAPVTAVASKPASAKAAPSGAVQAIPMVRELAKKLGVDINTVVGTGPGGRITREDVEKAKGGAGKEVAKSSAAIMGLSAMQAAVARRVTQSQHDIPPIPLSCQIDMSAILEYRRRTEAETKCKLSFDAFFLYAVGRVIQEFPHFRSRVENGRVVASDGIHVAVAISAGEDLMTPVIKNVNTKSILDIDVEVKQLVERVAKHQIQPAEMAGGVFTISNLGMYPVHAFAAVIPPEQSAALAIGTTEETPVVRGGNIKVIPAAMITLSVDHRLINGREGAQFISQLKKSIETITR